MGIYVLLGVLVVVGVGVVAWLSVQVRHERAERRQAEEDRAKLAERYRPILDAETERSRLIADAIAQRDAIIAKANAERDRIATEVAALVRTKDVAAADVANLQGKMSSLGAELRALDEEANLAAFGFYKPHYNFADSARYAEELERIRDDQKEMLKQKTAAVCPVEWSVGGSRAEGKKATNQTLKLMLRAFNGECDAAIAKVRYNNVNVMTSRINKAYEVINSLAEVNQCRIVARYLDLKLKELFLAHEYEEKVQAEKEEQRRIREQIRDEEIAQRQIEKARLDAERDEAKYNEALEQARRDVEQLEGAKQARMAEKIADLERRLADAHTNKERAIAQAQLTRSGHVYVISNVGSFGEHVYKIGMTRRLDPLERIKELGDASVPFNFDVHAVIYSDDAPSLEAQLHREFERRRVNRVNERKEFFRVTIDEVAMAVRARKGDVEVTRLANAEEFRKTQALLEEEIRGTARLPISADTQRVMVTPA